MNRLDIVLDLETLGVSNTPVLTQIGAVAFDIKTGKVIREFALNFDLKSSMKSGAKVDAETLQWWVKQDKETIANVFESKDTVTLSKGLNAFREWVLALEKSVDTGNVYLWGNGIIADNTWLKGNCELLNIPSFIVYKNHRDVRTLLELAAETIDQPKSMITKKIPNQGILHSAIDDARWAAKLITACWNLIVQ